MTLPYCAMSTRSPWLSPSDAPAVFDCLTARSLSFLSIFAVSACRIHSAASVASGVTDSMSPHSTDSAHAWMTADASASLASNSLLCPTTSVSYRVSGH